MKQLLQYIKYDTYKSNIVIALLLGVQIGYTKFPCFLCEWDSRDKAHHCVKWIWPARKILEPEHKNVKHHSLVQSSRILLPPLHTKLGIIKILWRLWIVMLQHFCTCDKNSPCLVVPRYERVFLPIQTFAHFFVMRYLNASWRVKSREHDMPSERWLQAS